MNFASDNWAGASGKVLGALARANDGLAPAYGDDAASGRARERFCRLFERDVDVHFVATGTAANALAVAALSPPWGAVLCHQAAHLAMDECGAPEFYGGVKLLGLAGRHGKLTAEMVAEGIARFPKRQPQAVRASVVSLTQATEAGTLYAPDAVAAIASTARAEGLAVHMDGARFANAVAALGCRPADITWKAGVDVLSLGGTKNGCLLAECVVVFTPEKAATLAHRQKRAGHVLSKTRFVAAQFEAWLDGDHWLDLAGHANAAAARLASGIAASGIARLAWDCRANEVFAIWPADLSKKLRAAGAAFYEWDPWAAAPQDRPRPGEVLVRLVTSFATTDEEVDRFVGLLKR